MNFLTRLLESKDAKAQRLQCEAEAKRLAAEAEAEHQAKEIKRRALEEQRRQERQRTCEKCGRTFEARGGSPPNGAKCSECGGTFCYGCVKSEFSAQMERHPEKHDAFGVRRVQRPSPPASRVPSGAAGVLRELMDSMQPEDRVLSVADESNHLPCPKCLSHSWRRTAGPI